MKIADIELGEKPLLLAPMEDVTDRSFRYFFNDTATNEIYTYVKNQDTSHTGNISGLLVYAKTQEAITPDCLFNLGGNQIGARTLDLNQDFRQITAQLDGIAQQFFGKTPQRIGTGSSYPDG